ncbi:MAG TPA: TauD/TfdA family dioxygenase [Caulobacteraceae bacterium]
MNAIGPIARSPASGEYDYAGLGIEPLGPVLGAEVSGVDLREPLDGEVVAAIHAALLAHKVLVFRDQDIDHDQHLAFGRCFGELESHPVMAHVPGYPQILHIEPGDTEPVSVQTLPTRRPENKWHADVTFREQPSMAGVLRARRLPPIGGDTLFADMEAVLADLPKDLRARLSHLKAEHDILRTYGHRVSESRRAELHRRFPPQAHPVVRTHPETGVKSLFVNHEFTTRILGIEAAESAALLAMLTDRVKAPEYQLRLRWSANAVVFWDNRCTQHYPVLDYWPMERVMERVTVRGDRPF